jgi:GTPase
VFNKMDAVADPASFTARVRALHPTSLGASTMRTDGLSAVKAALRSLDRVDRPTVRIRLPATDGARLASLYRDGEVLSREDLDGMLQLRVRLHHWQVERLRQEGVEVSPERGEQRRAAG